MVIPIEDFPNLRKTLLKDKKIVCSSGFYDPIHPGHVSYLMDSKKFGDVHVAIVDGDQICITKKGKPFIPEKDRADIVDSIKGVDYVVIYNHPTRYDIAGALEIIKPDVFAKGGDRDDKNRNDPKSSLKVEADIIEGYGGRIEYGVGKDKIWSSSNYLQEWVDFVNNKKD